MREIKFRVWDKSVPKNLSEYKKPTGHMIPCDYVLQSQYLKDGINGLYPIMQYTGLKDKNGKEIYEGDICSVDGGENIYEIIFYMGGFMVAVLPRKIRIYHIGDSLFNNIEVIGNIHENPELLK